MKIAQLSKDELETMSYSEIAEAILLENNKKMKIVDIFKKICGLLELSESEFENRIADFFELISTDKSFIVLDKGFCDLRKKHAFKVIIEQEEEEEVIEPDSEEDVIEEENTDDENNDDIYYDDSSEDDDIDDNDDELEDFIVEEDEETSI